MSELSVPTNPVEVTITGVDGRCWEGRIFLPIYSHNHAGPMKICEWLEDKMPFFALLCPKQSTPAFLNKQQVLFITAHDNSELIEEESAEPSIIRKKIEVLFQEHSIIGEITVDMPSTQCRIIDYLNHRNEEFLHLKSDSDHYFVRKSWVNAIIDKTGD